MDDVAGVFWEWEGDREGARVMLELVSANVELDRPSAAWEGINLLKCVLDDEGSMVDTGESMVDTGECTTSSEAINGG